MHHDVLDLDCVVARRHITVLKPALTVRRPAEHTAPTDLDDEWRPRDRFVRSAMQPVRQVAGCEGIDP
jgi:hypothetical protein